MTPEALIQAGGFFDSANDKSCDTPGLFQDIFDCLFAPGITPTLSLLPEIDRDEFLMRHKNNRSAFQ